MFDFTLSAIVNPLFPDMLPISIFLFPQHKYQAASTYNICRDTQQRLSDSFMTYICIVARPPPSHLSLCLDTKQQFRRLSDTFMMSQYLSPLATILSP